VSVCILAVEAQSALPIWLAAAGRSKSFSAPTTSMVTPRNDTVMSTGHFQTPNWTAFVEALARRIASFDRRALAAAKNLVNQVSLPPADRLLDAFTSFGAALTWPEAQHRYKQCWSADCNGTRLRERWPEVLGKPRRDGKEGYVAMIAKN